MCRDFDHEALRDMVARLEDEKDRNVGTWEGKVILTYSKAKALLEEYDDTVSDLLRASEF